MNYLSIPSNSFACVVRGMGACAAVVYFVLFHDILRFYEARTEIIPYLGDQARVPQAVYPNVVSIFKRVG